MSITFPSQASMSGAVNWRREDISDRNRSSIEKILDSNAFGLTDLRGRAVIEAAKVNDLEAIRRLLRHNAISTEDRGIAAQEIAKSGSFEGINILESSGPVHPICSIDRGCAVTIAAKRGDSKMIQTLLSRGDISSEDRGFAVRCAAVAGSLQALGSLMGETFDSCFLSKSDRSLAVQAACKNGHLEIAYRLLPTERFERDSIIGAVARNCEREVLQKLLAMTDPLSEAATKVEVQEAVRRADKELLEILLKNGSLSEEGRGTAVVYAVGIGNFEMVQMLLADGEVSKELRSEAFYKAWDARNWKIAQILESIEAQTARGSYAIESEGWALIRSAEEGDWSALDELLRNDNRVFQTYGEFAAKRAAQCGRFGVLHLLAQAPMSNETREEIKDLIACEPCGDEIIRILGDPWGNSGKTRSSMRSVRNSLLINPGSRI